MPQRTSCSLRLFTLVLEHWCYLTHRGQGTSTLMRNHKAGMHPRLKKDVGAAIREVERRLRDAQDAADRANVACEDARRNEQAAKEVSSSPLDELVWGRPLSRRQPKAR